MTGFIYSLIWFFYFIIFVPIVVNYSNKLLWMGFFIAVALSILLMYRKFNNKSEKPFNNDKIKHDKVIKKSQKDKKLKKPLTVKNNLEQDLRKNKKSPNFIKINNSDSTLVCENYDHDLNIRLDLLKQLYNEELIDLNEYNKKKTSILHSQRSKRSFY